VLAIGSIDKRGNAVVIIIIIIISSSSSSSGDGPRWQAETCCAERQSTSSQTEWKTEWSAVTAEKSARKSLIFTASVYDSNRNLHVLYTSVYMDRRLHKLSLLRCTLAYPSKATLAAQDHCAFFTQMTQQLKRKQSSSVTALRALCSIETWLVINYKSKLR